MPMSKGGQPILFSHCSPGIYPGLKTQPSAHWFRRFGVIGGVGLIGDAAAVSGSAYTAPLRNHFIQIK